MVYHLYSNTSNTLIIKNSRFITHVYRVLSVTEAKQILVNLKKDDYYDATHITYAYHINNEIRSSDDGEVPGTAGRQILKVLEAKEIVDCLGVVIRYYGGIQLGIPGLTKAYTRCISEALNNQPLILMTKGLRLKIWIPYIKLDLFIRHFQAHYHLVSKQIDDEGASLLIECLPDIKPEILSFSEHIKIQEELSVLIEHHNPAKSD
jgi:putative IMPACT (imprinted ancient) family translation regulator